MSHVPCRHALVGELARLRRSAAWLAADGLEVLLEKAVGLQAVSLQGDGKGGKGGEGGKGGTASARATLRAVMGHDHHGQSGSLVITPLAVKVAPWQSKWLP